MTTLLVFSSALEEGYLKLSSFLWAVGWRKRFLHADLYPNPTDAFVCFRTVPTLLGVAPKPSAPGQHAIVRQGRP